MFSALIDRTHLKVVRMLGYVLTLGTEEAWRGFVTVLRARLTVEERVALAYSALRALDHYDAAIVAEAALGSGAGQPQAPLFDFIDQAASWADMADLEELEAYCLAAFKAMPRGRQVAFLEHVRRRGAA